MSLKQISRLSFVGLLLSCLGIVVAFGHPQKKYQDTSKLLFEMNNRLEDRDKLAALFRVGDEWITNLIQALNDPNPDISLRAQIAIRYLGSDIGMDELFRWYNAQQQFRIAGPIPLPLREWDYKVIYANFINAPNRDWTQAEPYIYALALDDSPKAKVVLNEVTKSAGRLDEATVVGRALMRVQTAQPAMLLAGQKDLAKLVQSNAFFVAPDDRKYLSAQLLGLNGAKDKALVEIYINRGRLSEEWYHVVIKKCGQGWKFFSVTQVAMS
jgi:hypothetical protein